MVRAAIVIGHGSVSLEITRQSVELVPGLVAPDWMQTRSRPIALRDVVRYLGAVLDAPEARGRVFEVGGPDVLRYVEVLQRAATPQGRDLPSVALPARLSKLAPPALSSRWLSLLTDVDATTAANVVDSLVNEAVVTGHGILDVVPGDCLTYEEAVRQALTDREKDSRAVT